MNKSAYVLVVAAATAAAFILLGLPWLAFSQWALRDFGGITAFIVLYVMSEALAIDFPIGPNRQVVSSIAFLPLLACSIVFPSDIAILAAAVAELLTQLLIRRRAVWLIVFNVSQSVISIFSATAVADVLGGIDIDAFNPIAFAGLAITFFFTNILLVGALYGLRQNNNLVRIIRGLAAPAGGNLFYTLLATPVAVFAAFLYDQMYVGGLVLMILPLLLIRYSYLSNIQLQQANKDLLRVLIKTIETRDPYTSGHSQRVSKIARTIAEDLGLPRRKIAQVETAALLHDIGKTDTIYATIIQKPTALTEEENRIIKTHAIRGAELLQTLSSFPDEVVRGVRHHHERHDGCGYPDGLAGKSIPLSARIIMLCDSIDAMLSDRPYRPAMTVEQAGDEVRRCAGTQFDPEIVDTIIRQDTLDRAAALIKEDASAADIEVVRNP